MKKIQASLLVIDDNEDILFAAKMLLKKHFETVITLNNPKHIVKHLADNEVDVVVLDMNYRIGFEDGREGLYLLREIKTLSPNTTVILMTAFGKVETAVEGLKSGAMDYVLKPWDNEKLLQSVKLAVDESRKRNKKKQVHGNVSSFFIGKSMAIKKVFSLADKVALTDATVLLLGENGTGKSVLAHYIHSQSQRKEAPFVPVDLGSLSENLFESELFGYAKGAFTDAKFDTPGRFEAAQNGTIFLDEIGNIPLHLQSKLLQVIQTKTVTRLGESKPRPLNVRIVVATNTHLKEAVEKKKFREDLYYRINTFEITVPSLQERKEDKIPLAAFLLEQLAAKYNRPGLHLSEKAIIQIGNHSWNGNIREMENKLERALIVCENNTITAADLDLEYVQLPELPSEDIPLSDLEKNSIERALVRNKFNISKSAEELGLSRAALYRRMEKYNIASHPEGK